MSCPVCGRFEEPDPDTGYQHDDICPDCADEGWEVDADGWLYEPDNSDSGDAE